MNKIAQSLERADLIGILAFKSPPSAVLMVVEAICILFGMQSNYNNFRKLSSSDFVTSLREFKRDAISDYALDKLAKYMSEPNFTQEYVSTISKGASILTQWSRLAYEYGRLYSSVWICIFVLVINVRIFSKTNKILDFKY